MKRSILLALTIIACALPLSAQTYKVNPDAVLKKVQRADADIENIKKNEKASTWVERGKVYTDAYEASVKDLYPGFDENVLIPYYGQPTGTSNTVIDGLDFTIYNYPYFDAYAANGMVYFWDRKNDLVENGLQTARSSYEKAYELDPKARIKTGMENLAELYKEQASNNTALGRYKEAAEAFQGAYEVQRHPAVNVIDTASVYNAGFFYTISMDFAHALPMLLVAEENGYHNDGDVYYYLFHTYYGLSDNERATNVLMDGLKVYPNNTRIVEGLVNMYNETGRDPRDILPLVNTAIEAEPENGYLWGGLGRIYETLNDPEDAIAAYRKSAELLPRDFNAQYNLGLLLVKQGDSINAEISQNTYTSQTDYNNDLSKVLDKYRASIEPLEKAHELAPTEPNTIELLKNVTFRLREEDGMMDKYTKYDELLKQIPGRG